MNVGRSENMRRIQSKDTAPELAVRQLVRSLGFTGYRLHRKELPGKPDIAFLGRKKAIFVHGCFWHGHDCKEGTRRPKSNVDYWLPKIAGNASRDAKHVAALQEAGWTVLTVWDCELKSPELVACLSRFLT
jgi:DNA mismatch endonuclease, patch repair protein